MTPDIGFMLAISFLAVWQLAWRTHVPLVIYATCAGFVLATTWGPELNLQLGQFSSFFTSDTGYTVASLLLYILPPLLTSYQFRGTMGHRILQQFVPAFFWGLFLIAFGLKLLPFEVRETLLENSHIAIQVNSLASWTVLLAVGVASIELMSQHDLLKVRAKRGKRGKHGKKDD